MSQSGEAVALLLLWGPVSWPERKYHPPQRVSEVAFCGFHKCMLPFGVMRTLTAFAFSSVVGDGKETQWLLV